MHMGGQEPPALSPMLFPFGFLGAGREAFDLQRVDEKILLCRAWSKNDLKILTLEVSQTMAQSNLHGSMTPAQARK